MSKKIALTLSLLRRIFMSIFIFIFIFVFILSLSPNVSFALGVDEKLPLRILKLSESKQTVLINRGIEDGLVAGDHARFFLTSGVVARAVLIKASPTRSVWSIYRVVNDQELTVDKAMNLKITPPVKLTNDPSKMLERDEISGEIPQNISLAEGADDQEGEKLSDEEKKHLNAMAKNLADAVPFISDKTLEIFTFLHLISLSTSNSPGSSQGTDGSEKNFDFILGIEKYFSTQERWFHKMSFYPFFTYNKQDGSSIQGHTMGTSNYGLGMGINWHMLASPLAVGRLIMNIGATFSIGNAKDKSTLSSITEDNSTPYESHELQGKFTAYSGGLGLKYYFGYNFGVRGLLDYYQRAENYVIAGNSKNWTKVTRGPRLLLGLGYRW
ncbi:MAG: hypothetical protein HQK53_00110 [Oligoflexia bacterium]|nr:hypothetical protein [Oligoflexia bacterium]